LKQSTLSQNRGLTIGALTTSNLFFSFLTLNLTTYNWFWTLQLELSLASAISHSFLGPYTASWKLINASSTKVFSLNYKTLQSQNAPISTTFSTCKLTAHLLIYNYIILQRPPVHFRLRSFTHQAPVL